MLQRASYGNYIGVYRVASDWTNALTYSSITSTVGSVDSSLIDYLQTVVVRGEYAPERSYWNITDIFNKWVNGTYANYGLCLQIVNGTEVIEYTHFYSNDETTVSRRPRLMVTYKDQLGLEDYWSFASHSAGTAGNGYVNLATGNLVFEAGAITTTDSLMPYTVSMVYNSALAGNYYTTFNRHVPNGYTPTGTGFKASMSQYIVSDTRINIDGAEETYYIYTDADATEHAFFKSTVSGEDNIYYDEDGLKLKLTVSSDGFIIEDTAFNKYTFATLSSGGILQSITDINGNSISFTSDENGKPKSVKMTPNGSSSSVTHFTITNNSSGVLRYVLDSSRQQAVLFYYSNTYNGDISSSGYKYLRKIVYAHQSGSTSSSNWSSFYSSGSNSYITVDAECYYDYDAAGRIVSVKDDLHKTEIAYTYDSAGRVTSVCEKAGTSSSIGQTVGFTYGTGYTKVRTSGSDDIYGNSDDIFTVYSFDNEGRCVTTYSTDINGYTIYGATSGEYVDDNEKAKNSIKTSSSISDIATNYLVNSNFVINGVSSLNFWTTSGNVSLLALKYDQNTEPLTYNQDEYDSAYNVKLTASAGSTSKLTQNVVLKSGTYTLSADLRNESDGKLTVRLKVQSLDNTSTIYTEEINFRKEYNYPINAEETLTFDVNTTSTERFAVTIEVVGESNADASDCVLVSHATLSKSVGYSMNNKVNYGSFETSVISSGTTTHPLGTFWSIVGSSDTSVNVATHSLLSGLSLYMTGGGVTNERYVRQTIYNASSYEISSFTSGQTAYNIKPKQYRVSGRALSTNAIPSSNSIFAIVVAVTYMDRSGNTEIDEYSFPFNDYTDSWQYVSGVFSTASGRFVKHIEIRCEFSGQTGSVYFDDISLCYLKTDNSPMYCDYDEDTGMLTEVLAPYSRTCYEYDGTNVTRKITKNSVTDYTYENNRVKTVKYYSFNGDWKEENCGYVDGTSARTLRSTTVYTYNTYGLVTKEEVTSSGVGTLVTTRTYNTSTMKIFGALTSETDTLGNTTKYFYDSKNGYLLASISPDGNGMAYTYDALGRMTLATPATVSGSSYTPTTNAENVAYTYDTTDRLSTITTDSTTYTFVYDAFGNTTSISAGSNQLAGYTYNAYNGKLATMSYGNGASVKYDYDTLDRVEKIWYKESGESAYTLAYEYKYDSNGYLHTFFDYVSDQVTTYRYDSAGRLCEYYVNSASEDGKQSFLDYAYDEDGRVVSQYYRQDYAYSGGYETALITTGYTYDDNDGSLKTESISLNTYQLNTGYTYDNLGRLEKKIQTLQHSVLNQSSVITQRYTYKSNGANTSLQISDMTSTVTNNGIEQSKTEYTYEYDSNGNITRIKVGDVLKYAYHYDKLGQLVRVDDNVAGYTYTYQYDKAGNITYKHTHYLASPDDGVGSPIDTDFYDYSTSAWGDLLTGYNSGTITYDTIGNPLTYHNGFTFTWEQGRRLAEARNGSIEIFFKYNDEGIRTSKTVNNVKHTYYLSGSRILAEEWGNNLLIYLYDAEGSPIGMQYRKSTYSENSFVTYWFEKNLQGDIIAVYDENGTKLVSYTYDAWGNVTTTYHNSGASTAAQYNPFRYRGYYYDSELGFYYLNSRYYDPETGRFISPDTTDILTATPMALTDKNLFAYCDNNPVMRMDIGGEFWNWLIGAAVGDVSGLIGQVVSDIVTSVVNNEITISSWETYAGSVIGGALGGAVLGGTGNVTLAGIVSDASTTLIGQSLEKAFSDPDKTWAEIGANTALSVVGGQVLGSLMPNVKGINSGRGNMSAVYKAGLTKLRNGTATRMSFKVIGKGIFSNFVDDGIQTVYTASGNYKNRIKGLGRYCG